MKFFLFSLLAMALAACVPFSRSNSEAAAYVLRAPAMERASLPLPLSLEVILPEAAPGLDSERIAVLNENQLSHLRGARWATTLPHMVQSATIEALEKSNIARTASSDVLGSYSTFALALDIREFELLPGAPTQAHVRLTGRLISRETGIVVATLTAEAREPAESGEAEGVSALERAFGKVIREIIAGTQKELGA